MKILFLSHYFPPEVNAPASRAYEHCKAWVAAGHEVTVVTCAPNHPYGEVYEGFKNRRTEQMVDGIRVIRLKTYITANKGFLKRTLAFISYMLAVIMASSTFGRHHVVLSTSPQFFNGLAGYFVSRLKSIPWLLEIRDLWPDSILAVGAIKNKAIIKSLYWLEMFCYKKCDKLVVVTDSFRAYMIGKGIPASKVTVIKNGVDLSVFNLDSAQTLTATAKELNDLDVTALLGKFIVSYVGTHGMAHKLETVLAAAEILSDQPNIHFLLVGDGAEKAELVELKEKLGLTNVTMLDQKPKKYMPLIWQLTNVSLVHLKKDDLFKTVIPSKIFEALAMEKPIILGVEGESAELIRTSGGGLAVEPENPLAMAQAILNLSNNPAQCLAMAKQGGVFVRQNFDRQKLAEVYEDLLMGMVYGITKPIPAPLAQNVVRLEMYRPEEVKQ